MKCCNDIGGSFKVWKINLMHIIYSNVTIILQKKSTIFYLFRCKASENRL